MRDVERSLGLWGESVKRGTITCYRCGGPHLAPACKFKEAECLYCKKKGHLARVCRAKAKQGEQKHPKQSSHYMATEGDEQDTVYRRNLLNDHKCAPISIEVSFNDIPVKMEVDTGTDHQQFDLPTHPTEKSSQHTVIQCEVEDVYGPGHSDSRLCNTTRQV